MPWSRGNAPPAFKNLKKDDLDKAISIANGVLGRCLRKGGAEKKCALDAIRIALSKVKGADHEMSERTCLAEPTRLSRIVENFNNRVRGVDIAIDVNHSVEAGAAGWIRKLDVRPSSLAEDKVALWAFVEWTPYGESLDGRYRYISASFGRYEDPETKEQFDDVLFSATLTNVPFVKHMAPVSTKEPNWIEVLREGELFNKHRWRDGSKIIQASENDNANGDGDSQEAIDDEDNDQRSDLMEKKLREILTARGVSLAEDADVSAALVDHFAEIDAKVAALEAANPNDEGDDRLAEIEGEKDALAERVEALSEQLTETKKDLDKTKTALYEKDKATFFSEMLRAGKFMPKEREALEKLYKADEPTVRAMLADREPVVDLAERGSGSEKPDREAAFAAAMQEYADKHKVSLSEASVAVLREHPELAGDKR